MIIAITGTPGTGKHAVAERLKERIGYEILDVGSLLREKCIKNISVHELNRIVSPLLHQDMIIVSHLSHFLTSKKISLFIVLRCDPRVLSKRFKRRGYRIRKVYDNVMFEALDGEYMEAMELHKNVVQLDNSASVSKTVDMIAKFLVGGKPRGDSVDYSRYIVQIDKELGMRT